MGHRALLQLVAAFAGILAGYLCTLSLHVPALRGRRWLLRSAAAGGLVAAGALQFAACRALGLEVSDSRDLFLYMGFLGVSLAFVLSSDAHRRAGRELAESRAQARSLESKIRPHFFFNTLNTVSAIIPDQPAEAQRILGQFANLFRGAMAGADGQPVPLATELALVGDYLDIERARFGARLRYTLPVVSAHPDLEIPPLTLQPLVENAVRHGIAKRLEGGEITVTLTVSPGAYQVLIANPVDEPPTLTSEALLPPGHSLRLIAESLELHYGRRAWIKATLDNGLFQLTLNLPRTNNPRTNN